MNNSALNDNALDSEFSGFQCNENNIENDRPDSNDADYPSEEAIDSNENEQQSQTNFIPNNNNNVEKTPIHGKQKQNLRNTKNLKQQLGNSNKSAYANDTEQSIILQRTGSSSASSS
ncbi:hypothetical protein O181_009261 [Austropuccinia psidii MF-1]|uniref:Uncharacterized protein n=1 Tax=Austropuccinia psidii MF-1 TaxID=1389203 RepID=A0A9Q3BP01_9BASI|nr:hypothetical protein [Austropuccinia psidii MF-1]